MSKRHLLLSFILALSAAPLLTITPPAAAADQEVTLPPEALSLDDDVAARGLARLAQSTLAVYGSANRKHFLDTVFRIQDLAGQPQSAVASLQAFQAASAPGAPPRVRDYDVENTIYEKARTSQQAGQSFQEAYAVAFRETLRRLDDRDAAVVLNEADGADVKTAERTFADVRAKLMGKREVPQADAVELLRAAYGLRFARATDKLSRQLAAEEDARRWIVQRDIEVPTGDGATICTFVVRPRSAPPRAPAALHFTIYADPVARMRDARLAAGYGYVAVVGLTRGKGCSPGAPAPYEHDGHDADALIRWTAAQAWSDGQVGMFGGSYSGFTAWSALKNAPKALKAVEVGASASPGIDVPMEGNVIWMFVYPWPFYTTDNKALDDVIYGDAPRWHRLQAAWYRTGSAFRDLDKVDGTPNPVWRRWLSHPAYDRYWRATVPSARQFAAIRTPVLQTAGYYYGGPGAAVWYLQQQYRANRAAQSYLLIGPYGHFEAQWGFLGSLVGGDDTSAGLTLDRAALIDLIDLRFAWFDHFMKGKPMPPLIKDRINYEVVGANVWKHAPSLAAMGTDRRRYFLSAEAGAGGARLLPAPPAKGRASILKVDFADRSDADRPPQGGGVRDRELDRADSLVFVSDPVPAATEISGLFSGHLEFVTNKKDFDIEIDLYELTPGGDYVQLAPWWTRASFAADPSHRHLLTPNVPQTLDFRAIRLMSQRVAKGSRIVAVARVIKESGRQINYGTGKEVSDETIADAGAPLTLRISDRSWIELPFAH